MKRPEPFPSDDPREWLNRARSNLARARDQAGGPRLLPKLRGGGGRNLKVGVSFELITNGADADAMAADLRQILDDLMLGDRVRIDVD